METIDKQYCALCLRPYEFGEVRTTEQEIFRKLEDVCSAYILIPNNDDCNFVSLWNRNNPLCQTCEDRAKELWSLDDSLQKLHKHLTDFVVLFQNEILEWRNENKRSNGTNKNVDEPPEVKEEGNSDVENWECDQLSPVSSYSSQESVSNSCEKPTSEPEMKSEHREKSPSPMLSSSPPPLSPEGLKCSIVEELPVEDPPVPEIRRSKRKAAMNFAVSKLLGDKKSDSDDNGDYEDKSVRKKSKRKRDSRNKHKKSKKKENKSKTTFCKLCKIDFENGRSLSNHLRIHEDQSWCCEICNETFFNVFITRHKHLKIVHPESELIKGVKKCENCQEEFEGSLYSYEVHLLEHKNEIPFECKTCQRKFPSIQNYTDHHRYTSCASSGLEKEDTFECELCDKVFNAKYLLLLHRLGHTNPERKPFNCEICKKRFPGSGVGNYLVEKHFIAHTKEIPFPCDICEKRYTTTFALENHRISHKSVKLTCDTCSDTFFTSKLLNSHKRKCGHENNEHEDKLETIQCSICNKEMTKKHLKHHLAMHEEMSFKCDNCGNKYRSQKRLDAHHRNCYSPVLSLNCDLETTANNDSEDKGKIHCEICGTNFVRQSAYENHLKFHNEENPYECANRKCKSKFRSFADLKVHYNENSKCQAAKDANKKMFKYRCPICSKPMKTPAALIIHERSHTGEKPFKCDLCDASFNRKDRLATHQQKHDKNYLAFPYPCKICPMKFSTHKDIVTHYKTSYECKVKYNESKKHKCDFCDKRFETKLKLIVHCRAHKDEGFVSSIKQPFECQKCGKDFGSKKNLINHEKSHLYK